MGTRYEDQPAEHWAGVEPLDPTPVWKQYLLVAVLFLLAIGAVVAIGGLSLATQLAAPPALVPGNRVVLAASQLPRPGAPPARVGAPLLDDARAFWISQPAAGEWVAVSAWWRPTENGVPCAVESTSGPPGTVRAVWRTASDCAMSGHVDFGGRGEPVTAARGLDRYLVSVEGDRIVVNVGRVIRGFGRTPQPTRSPLP